MSTEWIELTGSTFDDETRSGVSLVFFWDPYESRCRKEWEIITKATHDLGKDLKIGRCNVENSPTLAEQFTIRSIPTTILMKNGKEVERLAGLRHEGTLVRHIAKYLGRED